VSLKWPPKDPDEKLDYSLDWSRFLGTKTISSVAWFIDNASGVKTAVSATGSVNGLSLDNTSNTSTVSSAVFSAGTDNATYVITCAITFGTDSLVSERKIKLSIREK